MSNEKIEGHILNTTGAGDHEESFAFLLEQSAGPSEWLEPGQKVRSRVVSISRDLVYIDLGGKSEGVIDLSEFMNEDGTCRVQEGDDIDAFFVSVENGTRRLTTRIGGYSAVTLNAIRDAHAAGLPVKGDVKREVKGGFEISIGGVRCFCPFSQIDLKGGREGGIYLGRTFPFQVLEFGEDGRNVIVSRRTLLEQEKQARISKLRETLAVGQEISGRVSSLQKFGAFIDIGGTEGLIPNSEISWSRTEKIEDVLAVDQEVTVRVLSLDWDSRRLTLSLKAMEPDPWSASIEKYPVGSKVSGTIVRLAPFGAFLNVEAGIDGLIHISNLGAGRRINHPKEVVEVGQWVEAYVISVDLEKRKLSLSMQPKVEPQKIVLPSVGEVFEGTVEKAMPYGVLLKLPSGATGLIPSAEMGTPAGTDHNRMFPAGTKMQVVVIDVDAARGRIRLSRKGVLERIEQQELNEYRDSVKDKAKSSAGLGVLGELLKAKMEEKGNREKS